MSAGPPPLQHPERASNALGVRGYIKTMEELSQNISQHMKARSAAP